jgi:hypothetical protein
MGVGILTRGMRSRFGSIPLRVMAATSLVVVAGSAAISTSAGATPSPATISLSGYTTPGAGSTYIVIIDAPVDTLPTGTATITDSLANQCEATAWSSAGPDLTTGEYFSANCTITNSEPAGTTATASYAGTDYSAPTSNRVIIAGAMSTAGTLPAPTGGGSYTSTATTTLDVPNGDPAPTGSVQAEDNAGDNCTATVWTETSANVYTASCDLVSTGSYQGYVTALYGGFDYLASGGSYSTQLILFGDEDVANNTYGITVYAPAGSPAPTGTVTVRDSDSSTCTSSTWQNDGSDGYSSIQYESYCALSNAEVGGLTVSATYAGNYSYGESNQFVTASSLTISATSYSASGGGNYTSEATATLGIPHGDTAPTGYVLVSSTNSSQRH